MAGGADGGAPDRGAGASDVPRFGRGGSSRPRGATKLGVDASPTPPAVSNAALELHAPPAAGREAEVARLAALRRAALLDTAPEEAFDRLARLAATLLRTPAAMIALVDADREFFKSAVGLPAGFAGVRELPLSHSLCRFVVDARAPFVVDDARADVRVRRHAGVLAAGVGSYVGVPLVTADGHALGSLCVVDVVARRWTDADVRTLGDLAGAVVTEIELRSQVRERERAEALLRKSEAQFSAAFRMSGVGMALLLPNGRFVQVNRALCAMLGRTEEELTGATAREFLHHDDRDGAAAAWDGLLGGVLHANQMEQRYVHSGGETVWALVSNSVVRDARGAPAYLVAQLQDISARRQAEQALRESEAQYRSVVEGAREVIFHASPDLRWTFLNPSWTRGTGFTAAESLGTVATVYVHPDDREDVRRAFCRVADGEDEQCECEARCVTKAGDVRWLAVCARGERDAAGNVVRLAGTLTDVTERRRLEEELRQSQKMEAVGRLAGGVAHDFNNLLTAIKGYSGLLLESLEEGDERRQDVEEIDRAADRAAALTRQLLAFSRKQVLQPATLDLDVVVGEMQNMLRRLIGEDVQLVTRSGDSVWKVKADPGQLEQVVMNLVLNARDAMPGGGTLTLETANLRVDQRYVDRKVTVAAGSYVMLLVTDTGVGMDAETQARVFEPFFTTKERGKGTGLGLSTVYGIVKQSGGFVWVDSAPGRGTTFTIYLPRAVDAAPLPDAGPACGGIDGTETVLLVEDEQALRALAVRVLEARGYTVLEASNGEQALRAAEAYAGRIDLVVTDVVMPVMGGRELVERLGRARPATRVLYMSGYTDGDVVRRGLMHAQRSFVQKPFAPDDLARRVREVLDAAE